MTLHKHDPGVYTVRLFTAAGRPRQRQWLATLNYKAINAVEAAFARKVADRRLSASTVNVIVLLATGWKVFSKDADSRARLVVSDQEAKDMPDYVRKVIGRYMEEAK